MISSSRQATGVKIVGVDPAEEAEVTQLDSLIAAGEYFDHVLHPVLIGEKLAEKLKVKVKSKVVLTFQDAHGNITAGQFRVAGILHTASLVINETSAFVEREHLNQLLGIPEAVHEIAFTTNAGTDDKVFADQLTKAFPNEKTEYW